MGLKTKKRIGLVVRFFKNQPNSTFKHSFTELRLSFRLLIQEFRL